MITVKIFSWNVNSINARLENIIKFIELHQPDILLLQELKSTIEKCPTSILEDLGYNVLINGQKSYNGVAILSKYRTEDVLIKDFYGAEGEARYIEALVNINSKYIRVASVYVPNGESVKSEKFLKKLSFIDDLHQYLLSIRCDEPFFVGGDFNVAPAAIDLFEPTKHQNSLGFHEKERNLIHKLMADGFTDTFRKLYPEKQVFSWWDYRNRSSFISNNGWRIDYILSANCTDLVIDAGVITNTREWNRPSDHAPVWCELRF